MATKRDYLLGIISGFLSGVFLFSTALVFGSFPLSSLLLIPLITVALGIAGVAVGALFGIIAPSLFEFARYAVVGTLSASIDFAILNALSHTTGITTGIHVGWINVPGFFIGTINGYLWNKLWVFHEEIHPSKFFRANGTLRGKYLEHTFGDLPKFIAVTLGGLVVSSVCVVFITTYIPPPQGFSPTAWLNIAKAVASFAAILWNFIGYKVFVFAPARRV